MEQNPAQNKTALAFLKKAFQRYFIDAMGAMALGLFSSLIIGLILSQLSKFSFLCFLEPYAAMVSASSPVVGAAIGVAIAYGLKAKRGVDIIVSAITTIVSGCAVAQLVGPGIQAMMNGLGAVITSATQLTPFPMGILVSVIVGMVLTAPISSAALCIMLDLNGLAAGAAVVGCCCQMIGFAVASFRENGWGGLISQGIGTSMLQFPNIMRHPQIWIAPTLASAVLGPVSTCVFKMANTASGAGMGTSGLVGQFGAFAAMGGTADVWFQVILMHFILPAVLSFLFDWCLRKIGWVKDGYMKIN